jgi:hypothetical protein
MVTPRVILPEVFSPSNGMFVLGLHQFIKLFFIYVIADDSVGIVSLVLLVKNLEISDIEL